VQDDHIVRGGIWCDYTDMEHGTGGQDGGDQEPATVSSGRSTLTLPATLTDLHDSQ